MLYLEHTDQVFNRSAKMVEETKIQGMTGFRSIYKFDENAAKDIISSGVSRDFKRFDLYSDELIIDIDLLDSKIISKVLNRCKSDGFNCKLFFSGCKGYHIIIETTLKKAASKDMTYTQQRIIAKLLPDGYDRSIYRSNSLIRLPGTIHEKTGKSKQLLEVVSGNYLLDYDIEVNNATYIRQIDIGPYNELKDALDKVANSLGNCQIGGRYHTIFFASVELLKSGLSPSSTEELISIMNASWGKDKKDLKEVHRAISDAIKALNKGY